MQEALDLPGFQKRPRKMTITVPEVERRKNHIDLINASHPLLAVSLDCLQDMETDRPSAQQICKRVAAMKDSAEYTKSAKGVDREEKHVNGTSRLRREEASDEIERLKELIHLKDETIAAKEREIEELKKQVADSPIYDLEESAQQLEQPIQTDEGQYCGIN